MTHHQRDRRVLSFPAVHPCEGISPATLISSLITLSHNICTYQNTTFFFATQRRNAREAMRQVHIILIFLHEIQHRSSLIPESTILTFSELHFTFQKLLFLLQDCSREDARILMLAKSQHVASNFQSLIRAVATVLDVLLPLLLHKIQVCREVKELVELLSKQARKAKLEHDPNDELASNKLHSVLKQFEKGIEPDANALRGILDYLEIKTWTECNNEVKLLENEIGFEYSESNEKDVALFSSLVGFMSYCRVVIFETLDFDFTFPLRSDQYSEARCSTEMITCVNPEDFRCPISLELMTDPVTVSTGQTYDRASIKKWLKAGNRICPKTGEKLQNTDLVPNTTLKRLIQQFCNDNAISISKSSNRSRDIARTIQPGSSANAHAVQFLSWFLTRRLVFGTEEQRTKAAYEVRVLARSNVFIRACLIEVGMVPPLLDLLSSDDKSTQENAMSALLKLSKHATGPQNIMESDGLTPILNVLKKGLSLEAKQVAAATVFYLSSVKEYRKLIGENPQVIPSLVELVNEGTTCGKKNAVVAIYALILVPKNQRRALEAGVVHALVNVLRSSDKDELVTECLGVLEKLAENVEGAHAILRESESVLSLVSGMLQTASSRAGKEHSASILLSLCVNVGAEVVGVLAKDPSLMPLLYSLLTDGTSHAAKKARFLIKILQDFNETTASGFKGSSVPQERSLHVW